MAKAKGKSNSAPTRTIKLNKQDVAVPYHTDAASAIAAGLFADEASVMHCAFLGRNSWLRNQEEVKGPATSKKGKDGKTVTAYDSPVTDSVKLHEAATGLTFDVSEVRERGTGGKSAPISVDRFEGKSRQEIIEMLLAEGRAA